MFNIPINGIQNCKPNKQWLWKQLSNIHYVYDRTINNIKPFFNFIVIELTEQIIYSF